MFDELEAVALEAVVALVVVVVLEEFVALVPLDPVELSEVDVVDAVEPVDAADADVADADDVDVLELLPDGVLLQPKFEPAASMHTDTNAIDRVPDLVVVKAPPGVDRTQRTLSTRVAPETGPANLYGPKTPNRSRKRKRLRSKKLTSIK